MRRRLLPASPRHPLASSRGRLRAAQRLAGGLSKPALAQIERAAEAEVDALLARPGFRKLLAACQALEAMPEAERLQRLERIAWFVLELTLAEGDRRCAAFVFTERRLGRNPARTLAQRAVARQRRAAKPPATAAPTSQSGCATPFHDRAARVVARASGALRDAVVQEHAVRHAAETAVAEPADAAAPTRTAPAASRPRRLDSLAARLRSGAAPFIAEPAPAPVQGLLRAWAQGP
jgi:hypothetical protein